MVCHADGSDWAEERHFSPFHVQLTRWMGERWDQAVLDSQSASRVPLGSLVLALSAGLQLGGEGCHGGVYFTWHFPVSVGSP